MTDDKSDQKRAQVPGSPGEEICPQCKMPLSQDICCPE